MGYILYLWVLSKILCIGSRVVQNANIFDSSKTKDSITSHFIFSKSVDGVTAH